MNGQYLWILAAAALALAPCTQTADAAIPHGDVCSASFLASAVKPAPATDDEPAADNLETDLAAAITDADLVFTGKVAKVQPLGHTNSIPGSVFGKVTFRDVKALRGTAPAATTCSYSHRADQARNMDLTPNVPVLVVAKAKAVRMVVPATEANLGFVKKVLSASEKK